MKFLNIDNRALRRVRRYKPDCCTVFLAKTQDADAVTRKTLKWWVFTLLFPGNFVLIAGALCAPFDCGARNSKKPEKGGKCPPPKKKCCENLTGRVHFKVFVSLCVCVFFRSLQADDKKEETVAETKPADAEVEKKSADDSVEKDDESPKKEAKAADADAAEATDGEEKDKSDKEEGSDKDADEKSDEEAGEDEDDTASKKEEKKANGKEKAPAGNLIKRVGTKKPTGKFLADIAIIDANFTNAKTDSLITLHQICYDTPGKTIMIKKNLRKFNGFDFEEASDEFKNRREAALKVEISKLKLTAELLDLTSGGTAEDLVKRIFTFLVKPSSEPLKVVNSKKSAPVEEEPEGSESEVDEEEAEVVEKKPKKGRPPTKKGSSGGVRPRRAAAGKNFTKGQRCLSLFKLVLFLKKKSLNR